MMSKVYCVHMVNTLGSDLLFQDLDLVWYQSPLEYFATKIDPAYDMYFQHDGDHHPERFKPLAANTGVYFVRHNARTEYFFSVFVRMGELVLADKSHQAALTTLANEHMALWGLRVKILKEDSNLFLSGYHKNTFSRSLQNTIKGKFLPVLYHVNWMDGHMKKPALIESKNWFVDEKCQLHLPKTLPKAEHFFEHCCLTAPLTQISPVTEKL
jgi:Nucleotide-diphospho-sugar transferase